MYDHDVATTNGVKWAGSARAGPHCSCPCLARHESVRAVRGHGAPLGAPAQAQARARLNRAHARAGPGPAQFVHIIIFFYYN